MKIRTWKLWTKKEEAYLGKHQDKVVSEIIGRSVRCVKWRRLKLGIHYAKKPITAPKTWLPKWDAVLGRLPDSQIARQFGVTNYVVFTRRKQLGD